MAEQGKSRDEAEKDAKKGPGKAVMHLHNVNSNAMVCLNRYITLRNVIYHVAGHPSRSLPSHWRSESFAVLVSTLRVSRFRNPARCTQSASQPLISHRRT